MSEQTKPVRVEAIDWSDVLPVSRLFGSFRLAIAPSHLLLALLMVVGVYLGGRAMDGLIWGERVYPGEIEFFAAADGETFDKWLEAQERDVQRQLRQLVVAAPGRVDDLDALVESKDRFAAAAAAIHNQYEEAMASSDDSSLAERRRKALAKLKEIQPRGVFAASLAFKLDAFDRLVRSAARLRVGLGQLRGRQTAPDSVIGALGDLLVTLPSWMVRQHPLFLLIFWLGSLAIWSLLGAAIARSAAARIGQLEATGPSAAMRYAARRWLWFFLAPLIPLILVAVLVVGLVLGGAIFFNVPVLDILGGLVFAAALAVGAAASLLLIGLAAGYGLLQPAIAVEGTDAFDAVSRAFSYVYGRPWRWLFYNAVALVYGAITYLFVGAVVFLTIWLTQRCVGAWVLAGDGPVAHFDAMFPEPTLGRVSHEVAWGQLSTTGKITAALIAVWIYLLIALVGAYAVSFYQCSQTWIYLLLRRSADGTSCDHVWEEPGEPVAVPGVLGDAD